MRDDDTSVFLAMIERSESHSTQGSRFSTTRFDTEKNYLKIKLHSIKAVLLILYLEDFPHFTVFTSPQLSMSSEMA